MTSSAEWAIYPVHQTGALIHSDGYPDAVLTEWMDEKNGLGSAKFQMPDVAINTFNGTGTEVQLWRNGFFVDWLVCVRATSDGTTITVECKNLCWYFHKRLFGRANRTNLLLNPSFEFDPVGSTLISGWNAVNCTAEIINSNYEQDRQAVRLTSLVEGADSYLEQVVAHAATAEGDAGILTAWFYLESIAAPALEQRGIYMDISEESNPTWYPITMSQPTGVWTREQAATEMSASVTHHWQNRLYCPQGSIVYDACSLVLMESISTPFPVGSEQAAFLAVIVAYAQDASKGKSDNAILMDPGSDDTGVARTIAYQFVDHDNIWDKMLDFTKYVDGVDFGMEFSVPSLGSALCTRTLRVYGITPGVPSGRGRHRDDLSPLRLNYEIVKITNLEDGEAWVTSWIEMSNTSDPAREEGGAIDTSESGGLILEDVEQAPDTAPLNTLNSLAAQRVAETKSPLGMPVVTVRSTGATLYEGNLKPGDRLDLDVDTGGWTHIVGELQVVRMELTNPRTGELDLTFNRTAFGEVDILTGADVRAGLTGFFISGIAGSLTLGQSGAIAGPTASLVFAAPGGVVSLDGTPVLAAGTAGITINGLAGTVFTGASKTISGPAPATRVFAGLAGSITKGSAPAPSGEPGFYAFEFSGSLLHIAEYEGFLGTTDGFVIHTVRGISSDPIATQLANMASGTSSELNEFIGAGKHMAITMCLMPNRGSGHELDNYTAAMNGDYDSMWHSICVSAAQADPFATLRPIHEPNLSYGGEWYAGPGSGVSAALYIATYRKFMGIAWSVSPNFRSCYCWLNGGSDDVIAKFPGAAWVNEIGLDVYPQSFLGPAGPTRWANLVSQQYSLGDQVALANAHGLDKSFPEWMNTLYASLPGVGSGDDPYFIDQMHAWMISYSYKWGCVYVDNNFINTYLFGSDYPLSRNQVRVSFGRPGSG